MVSGRGDTPNRHDILTGSTSDGRAFSGGEDMSCSNWTSSDAGGAMVGHHDRNGGGNTSWNAAHRSRGCSQDALRGTGGDGLFYCFAGEVSPSATDVRAYGEGVAAGSNPGIRSRVTRNRLRFSISRKCPRSPH